MKLADNYTRYEAVRPLHRPGKPFTQTTINLGKCVIQKIKEERMIGKSTLGRLYGKTSSGMENLLVYVTEVEPRVAETNDGKLI
jgi:hypothetical protein